MSAYYYKTLIRFYFSLSDATEKSLYNEYN